MLLALALQAAAPAAPAAPMDVTVSAWARCTHERIEQYARTPRRARHVVAAAMNACYREERAVRGHFVARYGGKRGRRAMAEARTITRRQLTTYLLGVRGR